MIGETKLSPYNQSSTIIPHKLESVKLIVKTFVFTPAILAGFSALVAKYAALFFSINFSIPIVVSATLIFYFAIKVFQNIQKLKKGSEDKIETTNQKGDLKDSNETLNPERKMPDVKEEQKVVINNEKKQSHIAVFAGEKAGTARITEIFKVFSERFKIAPLDYDLITENDMNEDTLKNYSIVFYAMGSLSPRLDGYSKEILDKLTKGSNGNAILMIIATRNNPDRLPTSYSPGEIKGIGLTSGINLYGNLMEQATMVPRIIFNDSGSIVECRQNNANFDLLKVAFSQKGLIKIS